MSHNPRITLPENDPAILRVHPNGCNVAHVRNNELIDVVLPEVIQQRGLAEAVWEMFLYHGFTAQRFHIGTYSHARSIRKKKRRSGIIGDVLNMDDTTRAACSLPSNSMLPPGK